MTHYIQSSAGCFTDSSGNPNQAFSDTVSWRFDTNDPAPVITGILPSNGEGGVASSANLYIGFNELVQFGTGTVSIFRSDGTLVDLIAVSSQTSGITDNYAVIVPHIYFQLNTTYYVQIQAGCFKDAGGNPSPGIVNSSSWRFDTNEVSPIVTALYPANGETEIASAADLYIRFDKPVKVGAGSISIYSASGLADQINVSGVSINGNVVKIVSNIYFGSGKAYYIHFPDGCFTGLTGQPVAGIVNSTDWRFTAAATSIGITVNRILPYPHFLSLKLYSDDGKNTFLGELSTNTFSSNGIFNTFGNYGSRFSQTSIWITFGSYGGKYESYSAFYPSSTHPPIVNGTNSSGTKAVAVITKNKYLPTNYQIIDPDSLKALLTANGY
ncbi:MAG: Ig-like domain-containing protein [Candidatus Ozemobacteraceae bacterium]